MLVVYLGGGGILILYLKSAVFRSIPSCCFLYINFFKQPHTEVGMVLFFIPMFALWVWLVVQFGSSNAPSSIFASDVVPSYVSFRFPSLPPGLLSPFISV